MLGSDLKDFQMVNHFYGNNLIVTKTGLQNSLKNLIWWSSTSIDEFFPKCYELSEGKEIEEFKEDFRVNKAESILKKFIKKKEVGHVEKLMISFHVNEKRLMETDDYIDDPDLENLVSSDEWEYIIKDKFTDN